MDSPFATVPNSDRCACDASNRGDPVSPYRAVYSYGTVGTVRARPGGDAQEVKAATFLAAFRLPAANVAQATVNFSPTLRMVTIRRDAVTDVALPMTVKAD